MGFVLVPWAVVVVSGTGSGAVVAGGMGVVSAEVDILSL
jgi:hypothetical protein